MTCIIGLEHDGKVYMAGDRAAVDGWNNTLSAEPKVWLLVDNTFLFGTCGSRRMAQVLRYARWEVVGQEDNETDMEYLVKELSTVLRQLFITHSLTTKNDDGEDKFTGAILFGYRGKLYRMANNFQIDRFTRSYDAIGSGAPFALGALAMAFRCDDEANFTSLIDLERVLSVTASLCADVSAPFDILVLEDNDA